MLIKISMQFFGGRGSSSGMSAGGSASTGAKSVAEQYKDLTGKYSGIFKLKDEEKKDFSYQINTANKIDNDYGLSLLDESKLEYYNKQFENYSKNQTVTINTDLPKLEGSERQVAYANNLRNKAMTSMAKAVTMPFNGSDGEKTAKRAEIARTKTNSKTLSEAVNKQLQSSSLYKSIAEEKNAGKLIDTYKKNEESFNQMSYDARKGPFWKK